MKWTPGGRSRNLDDLRGQSGGGGGFRMGGMGGGGMGIGGLVVVLVLGLIFGGDFIGGGGGPIATSPGDVAPNGAPVQGTPQEEEQMQFMSFLLDDQQAVWARLAPALGTQYREARLGVFRGAVRSGCGNASAAMGPFYCPRDERVYLDLAFFDELASRFGAPGDFAQAYVVAHEIGHHVQNVTGTMGRVQAEQQRDRRNANEYSVRLELQADCYAGIWAHSTSQRQLLERGDVEEGLAAASAVGDDRLQQQGSGDIKPETFTHGTSAQRAQWFRRGLESGDPRVCNTFES
ncbi:MAG: neutral zinc metallopeptidase [Gemmatimonadaceae bacterium]|nr:neutral zinc metallopeptidase [Gemmatimonadaceae bacterium]